MEEIILFAYIFSLTVLFVFGSHGFIMIYYYLKYRSRKSQAVQEMTSYPVVTVQLPVYNEVYVVGRLIDASCTMVYPKEKLANYPAENECPECDQLITETLGFHQGMLLGARQDMDDIVNAVAKVYENRQKLAAAG